MQVPMYCCKVSKTIYAKVIYKMSISRFVLGIDSLFSPTKIPDNAIVVNPTLRNSALRDEVEFICWRQKAQKQ